MLQVTYIGGSNHAATVRVKYTINLPSKVNGAENVLNDLISNYDID